MSSFRGLGLSLLWPKSDLDRDKAILVIENRLQAAVSVVLVFLFSGIRCGITLDRRRPCEPAAAARAIERWQMSCIVFSYGVREGFVAKGVHGENSPNSGSDRFL